MVITRGADNLFRINAPTKRSDGVPLDSTNASATALFRLFNLGKAHELHPAVTRLRTANLSTITFEVPHLVPLWIEVGDTILVETDDGEIDSLVIATVTPGTDAGTPATNFDTFTTGAAVAADCRVGAKVTLHQKGSTALTIPISGAPAGKLVVGDEVEIQRNNFTLKTAVPTRIWGGIHATEDGLPATNHPDDPEAILLPSSLGSAADTGRRVRVKLGGDVTMAEFPSGGAAGYPSPVTWLKNGGFEGTIADTEVDLSLGDLIEIEIHFDGGAGLALIDRISEVVS